MNEATALDWLAFGALLIFAGSIAQALFSAIEAGGKRQPVNYWWVAFAWGAIMTGAGMTFVGAGSLAWW